MFEQALRIARTYLTERLGLTFSRKAREAVHQRLLYSHWRELESQRTGDLVARFGPDIETIEQFLSNRLPTFLIQVLGFILVIGALVWINVTLATMVVIPVVAVALAARRFNAIVGPRHQVAASRLGDMSAVLEENATGVRAIQALSAEEARHNRMVELAEQLYSIRLRIAWNRIASENVAGFIGFMGTVGMMSLGGYLVVQGNMTIGGLSGVCVASSGRRQCHHIWCGYLEPCESSFTQAARGPQWNVRTAFRRRNNRCRFCARGDRFRRGPICLSLSYGSRALQCQVLCQSRRHRVPGWPQRIGEIHYSQLGRWFLSARSWARCD